MFLTPETLSNAIEDIISGDNVKCAVAYWGDHPFNEKIDKLQNAQIICDIDNGSTSPGALKKLSAPKNKNLKHLPNLHAKVYISSNGIVICSANASKNALGADGDTPCLIEAGVKLKAESQEWIDASNWFDTLFTNAKQVLQVDLDRCELLFRPRPGTTEGAVKKDRLLELVFADPDYFSNLGISFVLTSSFTTEDERDNAIKSIEKDDLLFDERLKDWPIEEAFCNWDPTHVVENLRNDKIISIHRSGKEIYISHHSIVWPFKAQGHFFTTRLEHKDAGFPLMMKSEDEIIAQQIFDTLTLESGCPEEGHAIMSASDLAKAIRQISGITKNS